MNSMLHRRSVNDCKLSIKAYQNLVGALNAFDRLISLWDKDDNLLLSSVFCFAVVKYARPFTQTKTPLGKASYPISHLRKTQNFSIKAHAHLLKIRDTLVAHDDFESIEPKILQCCISLNETNFPIPITIAVSNKCLAFPVDKSSVLILKEHVAACVGGALDKLNSDLARMRETTLAHHDEAEGGVRYKKNYGRQSIEPNGSGLQPPDVMTDEWLNNPNPDFSHIHNGFRYEELRLRRDFHGPERIKLPDGTYIEIAPPPRSND
jgi:hypothetical protein